MTTFQEPQPQSRRAVRQSERGESAESTVGLETFGNQQAQPAQQYYADPAAARDMWDTTSRRAAQLPPVSSRREATPTSGRRSSGAPVQPTGEPLTYTTQARQSVPSFDGPSFRARQKAVPPIEDSQPPTQALPPIDQPGYRVRDFSPEGRRAAAPVPPPIPQQATPQQPSVSDLDYFTQSGGVPAPRAPAPFPFGQPAAPAPVSYSQPVAPVAPVVPEAQPIVSAPPRASSRRAAMSQAPVDETVPEATLTRRELRALSEADVEASVVPPALVEPGVGLFDTLLQSGPIELPLLAPPPRPSASLADAMAEFDSLARGSQLVEPAPWNPTPSSTSWSLAQDEPAGRPEVIPQPVALTPVPAAAVQAAFVEPAVEAAPPADEAAPWPFASFEDLMVAGATAPAPAPYSQAIPEAAAPAPIPEPASGSTAEPTAWSPPVGHWSTQADLDDGDEPYETTINRTVGSGLATTNALVLPELPRTSNMTGPLNATGEVMLTGSIDLPRSLASTGSSARIEDHSLDHLFDAQDHDVPTTDSAPVLATQAISTHNSNGHSVTHTQKPKGNHTLTILIGSAVAMAVVAVGLLVAAVVSGVF
jgi:hypothetical protein